MIALRRMPWMLPAVLFVLLSALNAVLQPSFLKPSVAISNLGTFLPLAIISIGQTYVILGGSIDLSLGAIVSLVNVVVVGVVEAMAPSPWALAVGIAAGIGTGLACGLANGLVLGLLRLQPIVTTFATSIVFGGLAIWVLPQAGGSVPDAYYETYIGTVLWIPTPALILGALFGVVALLSRTRFYTYLLATGGGLQAAFQTGLPVPRVRIFSHMLAGLFAALAALCVLGETAAGDPLMGQSFTLTSVSAVVLGCTALSGGAGTVVGSVLGSLVIGLINNVIFFAKLPFAYQSMIQGLIILLALAGGVLVTRR